MFKKFFLVSVFLSFCFPVCLAQGAEEVQVLQGWEENATAAQVADKAQKEGFLRAVFGVAQEVLPVDLKVKRQEVLKQFLAEHIEDLVLSYAQQEQEQREKGFFIALQVSVDQKELKELLKNWGTFYTARKKRYYQLHPKGFNSEDWDKLEELQELSGLVQSADAKTELSLQKEEGKWIGSLKYGEKEWTKTGPAMQDTWLRLWSRYFSLPEVKREITETMLLEVNGWVTTDGVMAFDRILSTWDAHIDYLRLLSTHMAPQKISAVWKVSTLDKAQLEKKLNSFVNGRGLSFSLNELETLQSTNKINGAGNSSKEKRDYISPFPQAREGE